jgi:hypothetical protein
MASSVKQLTLVMLHCGHRILLGLKKRGFGAGKINVCFEFAHAVFSSILIVLQGFGGKVESGETVHAAALRELHEEAGVHTSDAIKCGVIRFEFEDDPVALQVHVFRATQFTGLSSSPSSFSLNFLHSHNSSVQELSLRVMKCDPSGTMSRAFPMNECGSTISIGYLFCSLVAHLSPSLFSGAMMSSPRSSFVLMSALKSWRHFEVEINCHTILENFEIIYNGATKNVDASQLMCNRCHMRLQIAITQLVRRT